jgi:hypothetical protein
LTVVRGAPFIDVLGSYFPVWMFCIGAGILLTAVVRLILLRVGAGEELGPRVLVYPGMAVLFACGLWLAWSGF